MSETTDPAADLAAHLAIYANLSWGHGMTTTPDGKGWEERAEAIHPGIRALLGWT